MSGGGRSSQCRSNADQGQPRHTTDGSANDELLGEIMSGGGRSSQCRSNADQGQPRHTTDGSANDELLDETIGGGSRPQNVVTVSEIALKICQNPNYWEIGHIVATRQGTMVWLLHSFAGFELTVDQAFRITDWKTNTVITVSADKKTCLLLRDVGAVFKKNDCMIEVTGYDPRTKNDKFSKMNLEEKEITFSARACNFTYAVNEGRVATRGGTCFYPMYRDISYDILEKESNIGPEYQVDAIAMITNAEYAMTQDGVQLWSVNGVSLEYSKGGKLVVETTTGPKMKVVLSVAGAVQIQAQDLLITSSLDIHPHLYVRKNSLRVFYDGIQYENRSGCQSAGFDRLGHFRVFGPKESQDD